MNNISFVNIVNFMNDLVDPKDKSRVSPGSTESSQLSKGGLYIKEDDQDWGSAGMNDIQESPK